jgi:hypothetical protein
MEKGRRRDKLPYVALASRTQDLFKPFQNVMSSIGRRAVRRPGVAALPTAMSMIGTRWSGIENSSTSFYGLNPPIGTVSYPLDFAVSMNCMLTRPPSICTMLLIFSGGKLAYSFRLFSVNCLAKSSGM